MAQLTSEFFELAEEAQRDHPASEVIKEKVKNLNDTAIENQVPFLITAALLGDLIISAKVKTKKEKVIEALSEIYDPEIPINIYDLGLIYKIEFEEDDCTITMTLTTLAG